MKKKIKKIKNFLMFLFLIIILIFTIYLFRNPIIEKITESTLTKINGAKVEIEGLNNPIFTLNIKWKKMQYTDNKNPMKNKYEINNVNFTLKSKPLLAGKFIIENFSANEIYLNTDRKESGAIEVKVKKTKETSNKDNKVLEKLNNIVKDKIKQEKRGLINEGFDKDKYIEEKLNSLSLESDKKYIKAKQELELKKEYWKKLLEKREYEIKLKNIETEIKKIDVKLELGEVKSLEDLKKLNAKKEKLEKNKKQINKLLKDINTIKKEIEEDIKNFSLDIAEINKTKNDLFEELDNDLNKLNDFKDNSGNELNELTSAFFGEKSIKIFNIMFEQYNKIINIFGKDKSNNKKEEKKEKMPELPKFWIKNSNIKIIENNKIYSGEITNITNNQNKTKQPTIIELINKNNEKIESKVYAYIDNIKNIKSLDISINDKQIKNEDMGLFKIEEGNLEGKNSIKDTNDGFFIELNYNIKDIVINKDIKIANKILKQVLIDSLDEIKVLNIILKFENNKFIFNSNLDNVIANKINEIYKAELIRAKQEIDNKYRAKITNIKNSYIKEMEKFENEYREKLSILKNGNLEKLNKLKNQEKLQENIKNDIKNKEEKYQKILDEKKKELEEKLLSEQEKLKEKAKIEQGKLQEEVDNKKEETQNQVEENLEKLIQEELEKNKDKIKNIFKF
ncbi:uncharacterized protein (TIGR03545 family) [Hypnocyclicus thermotrophus]|uniref:Uncharacterized protein (TIGR03545 family) n=1 Tax=Hypnocyclicus thermotrophus TaxID=1627895 RepID=A0AA46E015_9FUSO|nr:hypothetical protein [Hypnocyclicus thermotrophus]TDT71821.1 uncharacterized protein (TIGR03545 family) [Hypnocyclicus thermotrophus]